MEKIKEEKTLVGLIIISWIFRVGGVLMILLGILAPLLFLSMAEYGTFNKYAGVLFIGGGILIILFGVFYFMIARGLDKLKPWARTATITLEILQIILSLVLMILFLDIFSNLSSIIISIIIIYYLFRKEVRESFVN